MRGFFDHFGDVLASASLEDLERQLAQIDDTVPGRLEGRRSEHRERYCAVRLLRGLARAGRLSFPLEVTKGERPDLVLASAESGSIGIEISTMTTQRHERATTEMVKRGEGWALEDEGKLVGPGEPLRGRGFAGDEPEQSLAQLFADALIRKTTSINQAGYRSADRYWLLLYDNSHLVVVTKLDEVAPYLRLPTGLSEQGQFEAVHILRDRALLLDAGASVGWSIISVE
jgi:hypothetical protein